MYFNSTFTCIAMLRYSLSTTVCMPPVIATHTRFTCIPFECALRRETVFTFYALFKSFFYDSIVHINEYRFECFIQNGNRIIPSTTTKTTRKTEIWLRILKDILFLHWHQSLKLQLWSYFVKHLMPKLLRVINCSTIVMERMTELLFNEFWRFRKWNGNIFNANFWIRRTVYESNSSVVCYANHK